MRPPLPQGAALAAGRAEHDLGTAGYARRYCEHKHGGEEGSGASGDIEPHGFDRYRLLDAADPRCGFHFDLTGHLGLVEGADIAGCSRDGVLHFLRYCLGCLADFVRSHFEVIRNETVDLSGECPEGIVAVLADAGDDRFHALPHHWIDI